MSERVGGGDDELGETEKEGEGEREPERERARGAGHPYISHSYLIWLSALLSPCSTTPSPSFHKNKPFPLTADVPMQRGLPDIGQ